MVNLDIARAMDKDPKTSQFLGLAYNQVGWALLANDRWEDAAKAFRDSIKVYSEWIEVTQRGFRPEFPWGGLAIALSETGSHEEAAEIFWETIRHREKMFGPADVDSIK
jgi:tetratricopeptide (TPR) repeat protein